MAPKIQGTYPRSPINQGPPQGAYEGRILSRVDQTIFGAEKARDVGAGGAGTGRDLHPSWGRNTTNVNPSSLPKPVVPKKGGPPFPGY